MFDPTAYENMKVVIEGALYDRDLVGEILILDRNDVVNLAKLSRTYEVTIARSDEYSVRSTFRLSAGLDNLAAELLPSSKSASSAGAHVLISFNLEHPNSKATDEWIERELRGIWGHARTYKQVISLDPFSDSDMIRKEIVLEFNRLIYEEQIDDIEAMITYMLLTLDKLEELKKG